MEIYKIPIEFAIITFPFVAFILTIPFLIYEYRKYGAIPFLKSVIFYSFILYLITAYFMVILPLPTIEDVSKLTTAFTQLTPFQFIKDIIVTIPNKINSFKDIITILNTPTVYVAIFNFILTIPFGVYLRYYFNKKWYHTIIYSFFLSLFFELTQLSGLYGIYPRPYRLFDVDDLILNTIGGLFGHIITPVFMLFLPTSKELENISYKKGQKVTLLRRALSVLIDIIFVTCISIVMQIFTYGTNIINYSGLIAILLYYVIVPIIGNGKTIGKKILKINISGITKEKSWYKVLIRYLIVSIFILYPYVLTDALQTLKVNNQIIFIVKIFIIIFIIINIIYYLFKGKKERIFLYEKMTNTKNVSTIIYTESIENEKIKKENKEEKLNKTNEL